MKKIIFIYTLFICIFTTAFAQNPTAISEIGEFTYDSPVSALTVPSTPNNYTVVNLRRDSSTSSSILGKVEMYAEVTILGEKAEFYAVEATCTDYGKRKGYIAKQYVKPYSVQGTAYINTAGSYDYSYASCFRYPDASSAQLDKIQPYTNVNVLYTVGSWKYCQYNNVYGFISSDRLVHSWYTAVPLTDDQKQTANNIIANSVIFMPNDKTSVIKGVAAELEQPIIAISNKSMIPLRSLESFVGATVSWNGENQCATLSSGGKTIAFYYDSNTYYVNDVKKTMDVKTVAINNRIHVPLRTVCNELGINIYFFGAGLPYIAYSGNIDYHTGRYIIDSQSYNFNNGGYFEWPVPSSSGISSGFGDGRNHKGIDITAPQGTPVVACADGVVSEVYTGCTHNYSKYESCCGGGYGNYVVISHEHTHNGSVVSSRYSHLEFVNVTKGQYVKANECIGKVGSTGRSTGFHLDFEITVDNVKTDPASYIKVPANLYDSGNTGLYTQPYIDKLLSTQPTF